MLCAVSRMKHSVFVSHLFFTELDRARMGEAWARHGGTRGDADLNLRRPTPRYIFFQDSTVSRRTTLKDPCATNTALPSTRSMARSLLLQDKQLPADSKSTDLSPNPESRRPLKFNTQPATHVPSALERGSKATPFPRSRPTTSGNSDRGEAPCRERS